MLFMGTLQAQEPANTDTKSVSNQLSVGVRIGAQFASFWGKSNYNTHFKPSFIAGMAFRWMHKEKIGLELGVDYTRMGTSFGRITITDSNGQVTKNHRLTTTLDYVQFPLIVYFQLKPKSSVFSALVGVGPVLGVLSQSIVDSQVPGSETATFKTFDAGLQLSIKPLFNFHPFYLEPEIGYYFGLTKIQVGQSFRNQGVFLRLGIGYKI